MARVLHHRVHGLPSDRLERLHQQFEHLAARRSWRGDRPWVSSERSTGLFEMEYFSHIREAEGD
ncbi:MAG TPA: hypothetical protein VGO86_18850, partial [Candidatus Dormibacteraeota bacterium]